LQRYSTVTAATTVACGAEFTMWWGLHKFES
jgi:hypothetical protein